MVVFHKNYVKQVLKDRSQAYSSVQHSLIDLNTRVVFSSLWVANLIQPCQRWGEHYLLCGLQINLSCSVGQNVPRLAAI